MIRDEALTPTDAIVIGGGPAGSAVARLLASWGHTVTVVTGPQSPLGLAESLPPSIRKLFRILDVSDAVDAAGFCRTTGNTVWWGGSDARVEYFPDGPTDLGYQVPRTAFDRMLLGEARSAGAVVHSPLLARSVDLERSGEATVWLGGPGTEPRTLTARFALDCTGRVGVIARRDLRRKEPGNATLALVSVWTRPDGWEIADPTHTLVETYRDGWAWSVPVSATERYVTFMIDRADSAWARGTGLEAAYLNELVKTTHFRRLFAGGSLQRTPWSVDASLYSALTYSGSNFLLVGDAGSFIDPMSSAGVKKALASAWLAAVSVHTCLMNPTIASVALDYFSDCERAAYAVYREESARYGSQARQAHPHPFWTTRSSSEPAIGVGLDGEDVVRDLDVKSVYERLRAASTLHLEISPGFRIDRVPTVSDRQVVLETALGIPGSPRAVRYVRGVDLLKLLSTIRTDAQVPDLFTAYCRHAPRTALPDFLTALATLVAANVVIARSSAR